MPDRILAIELSTATASVAVSEDGCRTFEKVWETGRDHAELFTHLGAVLAATERKAFDLILVGSGPGSYGGVRVALAAADGVSLVQGSRIVAQCSWEALTAPLERTVHVVANARRNGWVTGQLRGGMIAGELVIVPSEEMPSWIDERHARGEEILSTETDEMVSNAGFGHVRAGMVPSAIRLIDAWIAKPVRKREELLAAQPAPIYVRPPHITPAKTPPWMTGR